MATTTLTPAKELLSGNEAIARGALENGIRVATGYPGTPSTEILETLARYDAEHYVSWSPNEKVALDVGVGGALAGSRTLVTMKHVGLNVAADTLMSVAYTGVRAALVIVTADDPGVHSSQNEQDNRIYARFAEIPLLEPSDSQEAKDFVQQACEISERFDTPVLLRSTTRLSHTKGMVSLGPIAPPPVLGYERNLAKNVLVPSNARVRHEKVLERSARLREFAEESSLNRWERGSNAVGVITSGMAYQYVKEVLPEASILKLGLIHPLPLDLLRKFAASVQRLLVVEELEPVIEEQLKAAGIAVEGKEFFPRLGEFSPERVRQGFQKAGVLPSPPKNMEPEKGLAVQENLFRPPALCPGCPHSVPYLVLKKLNALVVGDIGCYTLAVYEPLAAIETTLAMGCSIGMAVGLQKGGDGARPIVATIGDSTFFHSGIPPLIDALYNNARITVLILDNQTTAMTGGQEHAGTGKNIRGEKVRTIEIAKLCKALGVEHVQGVDPYDVAAVFRTLKSAINHDGVSVVITNRPCVVSPVTIRTTPYAVNGKECDACQICMNLGCPAIVWTEEIHQGQHKVTIDARTCMGCAVCALLCPTEAIVALANDPARRAV
ncbi:MAG: indolepyruvate ferredoxin oxidoreductase subunit alpha [Acidobacteriia bacterium]|nr:indolepyruvate ferredoxin oxidoreductase subunit alpha [Terriglobia bacterium]